MDNWDDYDASDNSIDISEDYDSVSDESLDVDVSSTMDNAEVYDEPLFSEPIEGVDSPETELFDESPMDEATTDTELFDESPMDEATADTELFDESPMDMESEETVYLDSSNQELSNDNSENYVDSIMNDSSLEEVDSIDNSTLNNQNEELDQMIETNNDDLALNNDLDNGYSNDNTIADLQGNQDSLDGGGMVLNRDQTEQWEIGNHAIENTLEAMRDDLRDKGLEDGEKMEELIAHEKTLLQDELAHNIEGDMSFHYDKPAWQNDPSILEHENIDPSGQHDLDLSGEQSLDGIENTIGAIDTVDSSSSVDSLMDSVEPENLVFDSGDSNHELNNEMDDAREIRPIDEVGTWIKDINPNFDPFDYTSPYCNNCGSCAYAVYKRLEGDDSICATADNIGYNSDMEALTGMEMTPMSPEDIQSQLLEAGDGANAIIGIDRAEGAGHWFNAANMGGKIVAIDGQTGEINDWPPDYGDVVNWEMSIRKEV